MEKQLEELKGTEKFQGISLEESRMIDGGEIKSDGNIFLEGLKFICNLFH